MQTVGSAFPRSLRVFQAYGANTDVGKTIVSTILCKAFKERQKFNTLYLKPVSTGPSSEADCKHLTRFVVGLRVETILQYSEPVSPHIAARLDGHVPRDSEILRRTYDSLSCNARAGVEVAIVETAGAVMSPTPSGSPQADLYRPLRLPILYVGDSKLGGIGTTISGYESLLVRGYDVHLHAIFEDDEYQNMRYLADYFGDRDIPTISLPRPPNLMTTREADMACMRSYYEEVASLDRVSCAIDTLLSSHEKRLAEIDHMPTTAEKNIWYPFTQHKGRKREDIMVIDSAYQDSFVATVPAERVAQDDPILRPAFDGSASWWTQGLGHGNPHLSLSAAYAAGRYGHVMFAGTVHEPALKATELLLEYHKNPKLAKVYFTDNGSTGMEVAVKMALRAACVRYGWGHRENDIEILGLKGSYHGDTMGVLDCAEPSTFNQRVEWYRPKGYWFDYPRVYMKDSVWVVEAPPALRSSLGEPQSFDTLDQVFDFNTRQAPAYREYIAKTLVSLRDQGRKFGALIMEPIILGAGGMIFVDPLFQNTLIDVVRNIPELVSSVAEGPNVEPSSSETEQWSGLPVIFDEVFTGIYRLGQFNCSSFLQSNPDIVVNAKLLTGGLIPLCTTMASQSIFNAFLSDDKADALLHGHSYTAHAMGCHVAVESLKTLKKMEESSKWLRNFASSWYPNASVHGSAHTRFWSMWSKDFVMKLSHYEKVEGVIALGSVLAITLKDGAGGGYASTATQDLHQRLLYSGPKGWFVHSRVLGNVIYFMTSMTVSKDTVSDLEQLLLRELC